MYFFLYYEYLFSAKTKLNLDINVGELLLHNTIFSLSELFCLLSSKYSTTKVKLTFWLEISLTICKAQPLEE